MVDQWQQNIAEKLGRLQSVWASQFDTAMESSVLPVFQSLAGFLRENGFATAVPLRDDGRCSLKFELAEDAYLLMFFRSTGLGAFEMRCEAVIPGREPQSQSNTERVTQVNEVWARQEIQAALSTFVDRLSAAYASPTTTKIATHA